MSSASTAITADILQVLVNIAPNFPGILKVIVAISTLLGAMMIIGTIMALNAYYGSDGKYVGSADITPGRAVIRIVIGCVLVMPVFMMSIGRNTAFDGAAVSGGAFSYQSSGLSQQQQVALDAIFGLFVIVGYIAFIRGWRLLDKQFSGLSRDGASAGVTHIIAGILLVYLDVLLSTLSSWTGFDFVHLLVF